MFKKSKNKFKGRVLYYGQMYYHAWYLSRELRKLGWRADVVNYDHNENNQMYYHGEDFRFRWSKINSIIPQVLFYIKTFFSYDIIHFSGAEGIGFLWQFYWLFRKLKIDKILPESLKRLDIKLLKLAGKKIVYSNSGCLDGVSQTSFSKWGPENVCRDYCIWYNHPEACSDKKNLAWGKIRNKIADYQCALGGNRADYNDDPKVHEVPWFYCLDKNFWNPNLLVPTKYRLPFSEDTIKIFHSVGNFESRTTAVGGKNIKCTHIYIPLIERLKKEGYKIELIFFQDVPNKKLRYYQIQADIIVDMLTYGFFGAQVREGMMLGIPCVCYLRPEWLESMRKEIPEYVDELPVVNAVPETIQDVLKDLIENPQKREEIGRRSRAFALKWHSSTVGAKKMEQIYLKLLQKND